MTDVDVDEIDAALERAAHAALERFLDELGPALAQLGFDSLPAAVGDRCVVHQSMVFHGQRPGMLRIELAFDAAEGALERAIARAAR